MMSRQLVAVVSERESTFPPSLSSGIGLRCLMSIAVALVVTFGISVRPLAAQQVSPSESTAPSPTAEAAAPPVHPVVTYEHGQLTVVAENATLSEVMAALHGAMGTDVDVPAASAGERVWAHLGPGSAHRVLMDLFANTDLDYVVQGSPTDPNAIRSVMLSVRSQDAGKSGPVGAESASGPRRPHFVTAPAQEPEPIESAPAPAPSAQQASATPATQTPTAQPAPAADSTTAAGQTASSASGSAIPEPTTPSTVQASMEPTGTPNLFPQTPQPTAGSFNPHPSPPPNMSTDQMVQQLANMYQQRRQMQTGQSTSPN